MFECNGIIQAPEKIQRDEWVKAMIYSQTANMLLTLEQNHVHKEINKNDHITGLFSPKTNVSAWKICMSYTYIFIYCIFFIIQIYIGNKMKKGNSNNDVIGKRIKMALSVHTVGWLVGSFKMTIRH